MTHSLSDICNRRIIVCEANTPLSSAIELFRAKNSESFILVKDKENIVGILSPQQMLIIINNNENAMTEDVALDLHSLDSEQFSNDLKLLNEIRKAEGRFGVPRNKEIIVCYEPVKPFSITLPMDKLQEEVGKCVLVNCNTAYANAFKTKKELLINKETFKSRMAKSIDAQKKVLEYFLMNHFFASNIESHQFDTDGQDKWFLNDIFAEIESSCVTRIWFRKRDITEQKKLKSTLEIRTELIKQEENVSHTGSWEYNISDKQFRVSQELFGIFEIEPDSLVDWDKTTAPCAFFCKLISSENKDEVEAQHLLIPSEPRDFSFEFDIITVNGHKKNIKEVCRVVLDLQNTPVSIIGVVQDVTSKKELEKNIKKLNWALLALGNVGLAISRIFSKEELFRASCESITFQNELYSAACILEVFGDNAFEVQALAENGKQLYFEKTIHHSQLLGQKAILKALTSKKSEVEYIELSEIEKSTYFLNFFREKYFRSVLVIPIVLNDKGKR